MRLQVCTPNLRWKFLPSSNTIAPKVMGKAFARNGQTQKQSLSFLLTPSTPFTPHLLNDSSATHHRKNNGTNVSVINALKSTTTRISPIMAPNTGFIVFRV